MITLRDYQSDAVDNLRDAFRAGNRRLCFVLPTGGGKTITASYMAQNASAKRIPVLILAHRIELIEQFAATLRQFRIPHGIIAAGRSMNREPVQVGMIGTVANRLDRIPAPGLIIVDEAHHATAKSYRRILDAFPAARVIGLTATPARTDGKGLGEVFDALVTGPTMRQLIDGGHLAPYRLFCPPNKMDLSGVHRRAGDFAKGELAERVDKSEIIGDAVAHYRKYAPGQTFAAFCVSVEHAAHVADQFTMAGIPTRPIDGGMNRGDRARTLDMLRSGELAGITSCDLISEGFDLPKIGAAIMLRPTQSLIIHLQQIGRALRPEPGKVATILDHAGNTLRHGLPDIPRDWTLDGGASRATKAENGIAIRHCRECFAIYPAALDECPHCHAVARLSARKIEERDGELIEITEQIEAEERWREGHWRERIRDCQSIGDLIQMQEARGYKKGWVLGRAQDHLGMTFDQAARACGYSEIFIVKAKEKREAA